MVLELNTCRSTDEHERGSRRQRGRRERQEGVSLSSGCVHQHATTDGTADTTGHSEDGPPT